MQDYYKLKYFLEIIRLFLYDKFCSMYSKIEYALKGEFCDKTNDFI